MPTITLEDVKEEINDMVIIDWDAALTQACDDESFLLEVLQDLLDEIKTARKELQTGLNEKDHTAVKTSSHRIKGSASYLHCERLRDVCKHLQQVAGSEGEWSLIEDLFGLFEECVDELIEAVSKRETK